MLQSYIVREENYKVREESYQVIEKKVIKLEKKVIKLEKKVTKLEKKVIMVITWSPRMVFMSTANRDQKSSLCSTSRSLNQANAWRNKS